jgi:hypothetical protein
LEKKVDEEIIGESRGCHAKGEYISEVISGSVDGIDGEVAEIARKSLGKGLLLMENVFGQSMRMHTSSRE